MSLKVPKIGIYGDSGSGKTWAGLSLPGNKFVIDCEGGALVYEGRPELPNNGKFDGPKIVLDNPFALREELKRFVSKPGDANLLQIDPITTVYQSVCDEVEAANRASTNSRGKRTVSELENGLDISSWQPIKRIMREHVWRLLRRCTVPVIVTARQKLLYPTQAPEPMADDQFVYEMDAVFRCELVGSRHVFHVRKGRFDHLFRPGQCFTDKPLHEYLQIWFPDAWGQPGEPAPMPTDEMCTEFEQLTAHMRPATVIEALKRRGADSFPNLRLAQAEEILVTLRQAKRVTPTQPNPTPTEGPATNGQPHPLGTAS